MTPIGNRRSLNLIAAMALASITTGIPAIGGQDDPFENKQNPDNRDRRTEKDAIALSKAETKRQRKAAKRAALANGE